MFFQINSQEEKKDMERAKKTRSLPFHVANVAIHACQSYQPPDEKETLVKITLHVRLKQSDFAARCVLKFEFFGAKKLVPIWEGVVTIKVR